MSVAEVWGMRCPICGSDESLEIRAYVSVKLCANGTDTDDVVDGGHEWDDESDCFCTSCADGFTVRDAKLGHDIYTVMAKAFLAGFKDGSSIWVPPNKALAERTAALMRHARRVLDRTTEITEHHDDKG